MNINRALGIKKEILIALCAKSILDTIWQNLAIAGVVGLTVFSWSLEMKII